MSDEMMRRALGQLPSMEAMRELEELTGPNQLPPGGPRLVIAGAGGISVQASEVAVVVGSEAGAATLPSYEQCVELIESLRTISTTVREHKALAPQDQHVVLRALQVATQAAGNATQALIRGGTAVVDFFDENPAIKQLAMDLALAMAQGAVQGAVCGYGYHSTSVTQTAIHVGEGASAKIVVNNGGISGSNIKL